MNLRVPIWFSLLLNLALGTALCWSMKHPPAVAVSAHPPAVTQTSAAALSSLPPTAGTSVDSPFRWSQIAAADLEIYRDNLRALGCPEVTVREIIRAVINQQYIPRRTAILASFQSRFWDLVVRGELARRQQMTSQEWGKPLAELSAARQNLITDVLGSDSLATETERQTQHANRTQQLAWLPADKRDRLIALEEKQDQSLTEWSAAVAARPDKTATAGDNARRDSLEQEFASAKQQLLTPGEQGEFQLRESSHANWASGLSGFAPTEAEWRAVTALRTQNEEARQTLSSAGLSADELAGQEQTLDEQLNQATQQILGTNRFAKYQLASDGEYQGVRDLTQRYGLSDNIAAQAWQVKKDAVAAAEQIRNHSDLTPDARQYALAAIQQETQRTLTQTLGETVFSTYLEYQGDWLQTLEP